jgi:hypothetical protein
MKGIIEEYVKKLIDNVPCHCSKNIETIDIILDGGIFNGSYQIGGLYFLKEMENQKKIKIDKFSCCSVGALCALLYYINRLDLALELYDLSVVNFKKYKQLLFLHSYIDDTLAPLLPADAHNHATNKIYICYYDVKKKRKIVRQSYKSNKDLLECIKRSTFIPYFINGDALLNKRYIDGINPNILKCEPNKKILYIDLLGMDKIADAFSIKNEKTNFHRILSGVLDIHLFFIKQTNTQMCSYVNDWSFYCWYKNKIIKLLIENSIVYLISLYICMKKYIPERFKETLIAKIGGNVFGLLLEHYCI